MSLPSHSGLYRIVREEYGVYFSCICEGHPVPVCVVCPYLCASLFALLTLPFLPLSPTAPSYPLSMLHHPVWSLSSYLPLFSPSSLFSSLLPLFFPPASHFFPHLPHLPSSLLFLSPLLLLPLLPPPPSSLLFLSLLSFSSLSSLLLPSSLPSSS